MLTLTASGSVSDYWDTLSLQQGVATAAGVDESLVAIRITVASVRITATIAVPAATTAVAVQESLSSTLGNATSASAALGITVESEPTIHILTDSTDDVAVAAIAGGSAGGVLACIFMVLVGVAGRACYMKRQTAKALINIEKARAPTTIDVVPDVVHTSPWDTSGDTARALEVPTLPAKASLLVRKEPVEPHVSKRSGPQNIAAALVACGLEHRVKTFEDDGYTLDKARTALSAGEKVLMADLRERKLPLGECRKMINQLQGTDYDTSVAGSSPIVGNQVIMWLTEICDINASDAKLYADAFAELGIDTPEDLHMIDGDEVAWPSVIKPVHRKKIQAALESSRKMPLGRKMSDTI